MTAKIYNIWDYKKVSPNVQQGTLEQQAIGLVGFLNGLTDVSQANAFHTIGQGIDGMTFEKDPA